MVSQRGRVRNVELRVTETIAPGQVFVPFHYAEANANQVTQSAFDPISREPNYKQSAVRGGEDGGSSMNRLVVVGNGMAGVACVEQILKHAPRFEVTIFGDETHVNYNRILLSSVLAGEKTSDDIALNPIEWYERNNIQLRVGTRITDVDPVAKTVTAQDGAVTPFDTLLLATGSSAWMPPIDGLDKDGVFAFRTLDDTRALLGARGPGAKAVVIGGGLLGLEAARGLQVQGCDVTVVHLMNTLMERQLDPTGGGYLIGEDGSPGHPRAPRTQHQSDPRERARRGGRVRRRHVHRRGSGRRRGRHPPERRARPQGRRLQVNRGIVVNDHLETSHPDIFAVGECVEHNGVCYGLVAPLYRAGQGARRDDHREQGPDVHRQRAGGQAQDHGRRRLLRRRLERCRDAEPVRFEDPGARRLQEAVVRDGKLAGVILVGDTSDSARYMEWLRIGADLTQQRRHLLFPPPGGDTGLDIAQMADSATVCGCVGVTKGAIIQAIHGQGVNTLSQLKEARAPAPAAAAARRCARTCSRRWRRSSRKKADACSAAACRSTRRACATSCAARSCASVQDVLDIYGNGIGCEVCKPALSYMLDMLWCGDHDEDRSARFINDRVHANIQKDGTFSVVPRIRGGVTSPDELRRIADVADKYKVPMVKITGSQRIDLLGIKKEDLPKVWADLGMPSGQAYTKGVRMVKTCVGTDFCRFGTQDSTAAGIEMERRFENLFTPHKVKMGAVGCPRNCAEATVKDIGLVGQEGGWQVVVGGAAGKSVRKADLLITVETTEAGARGRGAVLPVLPRARQLSRAHLRLRRAARDRQGPEGDGVRAGQRARRRCSIACESRRRARATRGRKGSSRGPDAVHSARADRGSRMNTRLDSDHADSTTSRCAKGAPCWSASARLRSSISAIGFVSRSTTAVLTRADRSCDGIVTGASVVCPLHAWKVNLETGQVERPSTARTTASRPTRRASRTESSRSSCRSPSSAGDADQAACRGMTVKGSRAPGTCRRSSPRCCTSTSASWRGCCSDRSRRSCARSSASRPRSRGCWSPSRCSAARCSGRCSACSADRIGGRRTGLIGLALTLVTLFIGWKLASTPAHFYVARVLPRACRRQLRGGAAAREPLVSGRIPGTGHGHRRRRQFRIADGHAVRAATRRAIRLGEHVRPRDAARGRRVRRCLRCSRGTVRSARRRRRWRDYAAVLREPDTFWFSFLYGLTFGGFVGFASFLTTFFHEQYQVSRVAAGDFTTIVVVVRQSAAAGGRLALRPGRRLSPAGACCWPALRCCVGAVAMLPSVHVVVALLFFGMGLLGMGNGAVFQLVPQRFPDRIGIVTGVVGAAGGLGGFFLPSVLGAVRELTGSYCARACSAARQCSWPAPPSCWSLARDGRCDGIARRSSRRASIHIGTRYPVSTRNVRHRTGY